MSHRTPKAIFPFSIFGRHKILWVITHFKLSPLVFSLSRPCKESSIFLYREVFANLFEAAWIVKLHGRCKVKKITLASALN